MTDFDVAVVGGGPAGLAAAVSAADAGARVLILERDDRLGGILGQCIHNGFGLHYFGKELTGPEYAARFVRMAEERGVSAELEAAVLDVSPDLRVRYVSPDRGMRTVSAGAVVLAMGCRERTAGAIRLPGTRPAGVWTAGAAQRICNKDGYLVGRKAVILGSGDIGLIMARRMTYEGAEVPMVLEIMPYSAGLKRNIVQCLDDNGIPLLFSHTVTRVVGKNHVEGLYYAEVDERRRVKPETERFVSCDTLLLSVGLIPENDLVAGEIDINPSTGGPFADEYRQTSMPGVFSCGNALHVHDLVDNVSDEGEIAGRHAAEYALHGLKTTDKVAVRAGNGVKYALPQTVYRGEGKVRIYFRVDAEYRNSAVEVLSGTERILYSRRRILAPGEMECVVLDKSRITADVSVRTVSL